MNVGCKRTHGKVLENLNSGKGKKANDGQTPGRM